MSKHIVVSIRRDSYRWPVLSLIIQGHCFSKSAAEKLVTKLVMEAYLKRAGLRGRQPRMHILDYRVVDVDGYKRLQAAAKASKTIRRKRAAKKGAETRRKNMEARVKNSRSTTKPATNPWTEPNPYSILMQEGPC